MSHFTVLVIGDNAEEQLAPFNEQPEEHEGLLEFHSVEEEYRENYEKDTTPTVTMADGRKVSKYSKEIEQYFKRSQPFGHSSDDKLILPEGMTLADEPVKVLYPTFDEYMTEYAGYKKDKETGEYGYYHNPNAKWDWYQLGGRWTGYFKLKDKSHNGNSLTDNAVMALALQYSVAPSYIRDLAYLMGVDRKSAEEFSRKNPVAGSYYLEKKIRELLAPQYEDAKVGEAGLMTDMPKEGWVDSARIKDIDFEGMIRDAGHEAGERYDKVKKLLGGTIPTLEYKWSDLIDDKGKYTKLSIEEKRTMYHNQPAKKLVAKAASNGFLKEEDRSLLNWLDLESYQISREEYVKRAENSALSTFAVLKDGEWFEKGEMGWWGMVSNEKEQDKWNEEFLKLIKELPGDTVISVYDCHI